MKKTNATWSIEKSTEGHTGLEATVNGFRYRVVEWAPGSVTLYRWTGRLRSEWAIVASGMATELDAKEHAEAEFAPRARCVACDRVVRAAELASDEPFEPSAKVGAR
jgi:hypothetical protein